MASYKITQTAGGGGVIFQIQLVGTYSSQIDKVEIILTTDSHGNNLYEKLAEITPTGALIKVYVPWEDIMQYKVDELELYTFIKGSASSQTVPGSTKFDYKRNPGFIWFARSSRVTSTSSCYIN